MMHATMALCSGDDGLSCHAILDMRMLGGRIGAPEQGGLRAAQEACELGAASFQPKGFLRCRVS